MSIVLDTNVFISGIFFGGPPSQILKAWARKSFDIVVSQEILDEYQRVAEELARKFPAVDLLPILEFITIHGQVVDTQGFDIAVCDDPDDDKFIECALAANCKVIVSGDKHLLKMAGHRDLAILTPRDFVENYL